MLFTWFLNLDVDEIRSSLKVCRPHCGTNGICEAEQEPDQRNEAEPKRSHPKSALITRVSSTTFEDIYVDAGYVRCVRGSVLIDEFALLRLSEALQLEISCVPARSVSISVVRNE